MNLQPLFAAVASHQWPIVGAILLGLLVALLKQGWGGTWIAAHMPSAARPYIATGIGVGGLISVEVLAGKTWQQAAIDGFSAALLAIFGHDAVIEGLRKGKEIIPVAPYASMPPKTPPTDGPYRTKSDPIPPVVDDKPSAPGALKSVLEFLDEGIFSAMNAFVFAFGRIFEHVMTVRNLRLTAMAVMIYILIAGGMFSLQACTQQEAKTALNDVLDVGAIACIELTQLTDVPSIAKACQIDQDLTPALQALITQLVGQREAAKRAGFKWTPPDAGAQPLDASPSH